VQPREDRQRPRRVGDDHALGDLEHEAVGWHRPAVAHRLDAVGQIALDQRPRRQVDRDADVDPLPAPGPHLAQRVIEDVVGERDDAGVLGERDELVGREPAVHGCAQRSSTSTPETAFERRSTLGW
jgi:hypothetical protein